MIETTPLPQAQRAWFMPVSLLVFVAVAGFSVFFQFQQSSLEAKLAYLKTQTEKLTVPLQITEGTSTQAVDAAVIVQNQLQKIERDQLLWSKLIEKVETTVPKLKDTYEAMIQLHSYTGSAQGSVSATGTTRKNAPESFKDIALLIRAFATDPSFKNVFIPSINKSITPEGDTVLSFSMNFQYQKPTF